MSVYFETYQTIIQSMADFSLSITEGSFLLLNGQKHLRSEIRVNHRNISTYNCYLFEHTVQDIRNKTFQVYFGVSRFTLEWLLCLH